MHVEEEPSETTTKKCQFEIKKSDDCWCYVYHVECTMTWNVFAALKGVSDAFSGES